MLLRIKTLLSIENNYLNRISLILEILFGVRAKQTADQVHSLTINTIITKVQYSRPVIPFKLSVSGKHHNTFKPSSIFFHLISRMYAPMQKRKASIFMLLTSLMSRNCKLKLFNANSGRI